MKIRKIITAAIVCGMLSGCASTGAVYSPQALTAPAKGKAQLVIYRPADSNLVGAGTSPVEVNAIERCGISEGAFFSTVSDPGTSTISISRWGEPGISKLSIKTKPNARYFIQVTPDTSKAMGHIFGALGQLIQDSASENKGQFFIKEVDVTTAKKELVGTKQSTDCKQ